ncbi:hypothetical protein LPJ66_001421 [Kickxella alabastrina]|uniref:Uncharacterized protein n=1 Tax=Kickxella alabastrina TaxID=61397 RepID=A0ACC1ITB8_9FUNG|nr:hypothetical protein LPJ66_001421 [Kickxella alabastrina]
MAREPNSPGSDSRDHHLSRNGADVRSIPKKHGSGPFNWGTYSEMLNYIDDAPGSTPVTKNNIQVVDRTEFEERKRAMSSDRS